mmetsp:Transcript_36326/g.95779  ORF Transcript_36326/g.95779 Transcript_36326/m.95779 type:complete len:82 (-) Transcript_36326:593-838(-)
MGEPSPCALLSVVQLLVLGTVHTLDLSANEIGHATALELAGKLQMQTNSLRRLRLQGNGINVEAAKDSVQNLGRMGLVLEV